MESASIPPESSHTRKPTNRSSVLTSFTRCTQCNVRKRQNAKNLVVCIDGTSNQFGQNNTNVVKLFAKIDLELTQPKQHAYYSSGIGTRPKSLHLLNRMERAFSDKFDMAIAWNMEEIVKDAYGWLARTYKEGDQIYLFGFSRGAYQVRVLAGMIHEVGLIRTPTEKQIGTAYDHYETIREGKPKTRQIAKEFKDTFSWKDLRVHFVGVWDTVSSVGLVRGDVFLSTSSSAAHACHFRHALALDELRVKFLPEYFHEMNAQSDDGKSKYVVTAPEREGVASPVVSSVASPTSERRESGVSDNCTSISSSKKTTEIKEVWFAGSHSDVGGRNRPGKSHQAGNVSLLWMRREAAACGLVLQPTDIVWVPDDLDLGTSDSMNWKWRIIEYLPIKHQASFSGANDDARRAHMLQPRRIIPGQKVHASILYANSYKPLATLGEGFDIPIIHAELENADLDKQTWETSLFDDTAAQEILDYLGGQQGVAPIYLDRLLFMLRFEEGKKCVMNVPGWETTFINLINNRNCAPLVRLVTIVAYYEASGPKCPGTELSQEIFDDAKKSLRTILTAHKHRDGPRVVALLRPLTKHENLRKWILTEDILETLVKLLDAIVKEPGANFGQAMDGLNCLLQCADTRDAMIGKLASDYPRSSISRLSKILEVEDPQLMTAALRMVLTLARIQDETATSVCRAARPRIRELTKKDKGLVGLLAVEILLALYNPDEPGNERGQLDIRNARVRANLARALVNLSPNRQNSTDGENHSVDPGQQTLRTLFGLDAEAISRRQRLLIGELKKAVQGGNARERTAATLTLLKLCETAMIRTHLRGIGLLNTLVKQLQRKDAALLAAYALATCLKYPDMKEVIERHERLPQNIVGMLRLDYFDDAIGPVEGFQIFGDFMQNEPLREKIKDYNITEVLETKLGKGQLKEIRTSLICLDIFRSFDPDGPWTCQLVEKSMKHLQDPLWKVQKAGVTILSALAQTEHGVAAIRPEIRKIIGMLLPEDYLLVKPAVEVPAAGSSSSPGDEVEPVAAVNESNDTPSIASKPPSWMMGPACALRILAQSKELREITRDTLEYGSLKHLYLSGMLVDETDTSAWRVRTPNRTDVVNMLDKLIKVVDEELSEEGLMSIGGDVLPHIRHWNRLVTLIRNQAMWGLSILPGVLGVSILAILAMAVVPPIYLYVRFSGALKRMTSRYQNTRYLERLHVQPDDDDETEPDEIEGEDGPGESDVGSPRHAEAGPSTQGGADVEPPAHTTSVQE